MMARAPEILFVDPSVPDLETILGNLRPEVEAIVLERSRPAARQMAAVLEEYRGLNAVHVIAHGAPGLVRFAAGEWSTETLEDEADDLAAIGDALGTDRDLLLWSCYAGEGTRGRALVDALHRVTGAPVGAATHLVGAAALGGGWELNTLFRRGSIVRPPLTDVGVAQYAGLCTVGAIGAAEVSVDNYIKVVWNETSPVGTYFIVANDKGAQKVIGEFEIPPGGYKARIFVCINAQGTFIVAGDFGALKADRSIALCTRRGPTGVLSYHAATTSILGAAGTAVSSVIGPRRVGA